MDNGASLRVRGKTFRVLRGGVVREMPPGAIVYDVLPMDAPIPRIKPPPILESEGSLSLSQTTKDLTPGPLCVDSSLKTEEPPTTVEKLTVGVAVGQQWVTKDKRRLPKPFTISSIEGDFVVANDGRRVNINRLNRYRLVGVV